MISFFYQITVGNNGYTKLKIMPTSTYSAAQLQGQLHFSQFINTSGGVTVQVQSSPYLCVENLFTPVWISKFTYKLVNFMRF